MSGQVITEPQSGPAWKCKRCKTVFPKRVNRLELRECPQCTSEQVEEILVGKTRRGQVEAEREAARNPAGAVDPPAGSEADDGGPEQPPEGTEREPEVGPYGGWTKKELQAECDRRELPRSGNVTDLIDRLTEHDQQGGSDELGETPSDPA